MFVFYEYLWVLCFLASLSLCGFFQIPKMLKSIHYARYSVTSASSVMAARRLRQKKVDKDKLCSYSNFNPLAVSDWREYKLVCLFVVSF